MYKFLIFLFVSLGFFIPTLAKSLSPAQDKLTVGYFHFPPHASTIEERPIGAAITYFEFILLEMGDVAVEFKEYPFKRLLSKLEGGDIDVALFIGKTEEREKVYQYPSQSFVNIPISIATKTLGETKGSFSVSSLEEIRLGYIANGMLPRGLLDYDLNIIDVYGANWIQQSLKKIDSQRIDAVLSSDYRLRYELKQSEFQNDMRIIRLDGIYIPIYSAFSSKTSKDLIARYDEALRKVKIRNSYLDLLIDFYQTPQG